MNLAKKIIYIFYILFFLNIFAFGTFAQQVKIIAKIDDEIITNMDVQNEYNYLITLNTKLQNLGKQDILEFAKNSLVKEKIKKKEILKLYELGNKNPLINDLIKDIFINLGFNSEEEFKKYLISQNISFEDVYKKIEIESVWNQMIYTKFKNKLVIDENELKKKIKNNKEQLVSYLLYELVFDFKDKNDFNKKYSEIKKTINTVGFEKAVIKYSIANSKNNSGLIGWVNQNNLSKKIENELVNLKKGQITKAIKVPAGMLILKLDDTKLVDLNIDVEKELQKLVQYKINDQLNNYSTIYYNKIKNNSSINEF